MNFCEAIGRIMNVGECNNLLEKDVKNLILFAMPIDKNEDIGMGVFRKISQVHFEISFDVEPL